MLFRSLVPLSLSLSSSVSRGAGVVSIPVSWKGKSTEDQRSVDPSDGTQSQRPRGPTFFRAAWETQSAGSRGPGSASAGIIVGILQAAEFLDGCPFCCHGRPDEPLQSSSILPPVSSASVSPPHSPQMPCSLHQVLRCIPHSFCPPKHPAMTLQRDRKSVV